MASTYFISILKQIAYACIGETIKYGRKSLWYAEAMKLVLRRKPK